MACCGFAAAAFVAAVGGAIDACTVGVSGGAGLVGGGGGALVAAAVGAGVADIGMPAAPVAPAAAGTPTAGSTPAVGGTPAAGGAGA